MLIVLITALIPPPTSCHPGHMNIPYYKEQKERAEEKKLQDEMRRCRSARTVDPNCQKFAYLRSDAGAVGPSVVVAVAAAVAMGMHIR